MNLKNNPLLNKVYDFYLYPSSIRLKYRLKNNNTAILLGTPIHKNIGDHLLADSEIDFLKNKCGYDDVVEIPTRFLLNNISEIIKMIPVESPIFITGGGWMGNTWPEDQKKLEIILEVFQFHKIIILPQTVYYDVNTSNDEIESTKHLYSKVKGLLIYCRDRGSYNCVEKYFISETVKASFKPDMALYNHPLPLMHKETHRWVCCLREDREKARGLGCIKYLQEYADKHNIKIIRKSTISKRTTPTWRRRQRITEILKCFRTSDLVITDRLHGMLFAYLVSTPCVSIDNSTHKVRGVYEAWLKHNDLIKFATEDTDVNEIIGFTQKTKRGHCPFENSELLSEFSIMADEIKNFIGRN